MKRNKMKPLLIELLLITLTVCASSSHPLESTQSPLVDAKKGNISLISSSKKLLQSEEIRLNITLKSDENEKENVDIDMGKYWILS